MRIELERMTLGEARERLGPNDTFVVFNEQANRFFTREGSYAASGTTQETAEELNFLITRNWAPEFIAIIFRTHTAEELAAMPPMQRLAYECKIAPVKKAIDPLALKTVLAASAIGVPDNLGSINRSTVAALLARSAHVRNLIPSEDLASFDIAVDAAMEKLRAANVTSPSTLKISQAIKNQDCSFNLMRKHYIIGCGGVGSWLAPSLCLLRSPQEVILVDGDTLETKNLNRQLFTPEQVGSNKAEALAAEVRTAKPSQSSTAPAPSSTTRRTGYSAVWTTTRRGWLCCTVATSTDAKPSSRPMRVRHLRRTIIGARGRKHRSTRECIIQSWPPTAAATHAAHQPAAPEKRKPTIANS